MSLHETITEKRVRKGAEFLDLVAPKWYRIVKLRELNLSVSCSCVLGQLDEALRPREDNYSFFGSYDHALDTMLPFVSDRLRRRRACELGFDATTQTEYEWDALTDAWKNEIRTRRGVRV